MKNDGRLNLRLDPALVEWAKKYCADNGVTLSYLIRHFLIGLKKDDEERQASRVDAEQI